eukprot:Lithocolla_globosa_v1_NODE_3252_length_1719_cov_5.565505.p2 type:complete len:116 gc:universal NODE_3252_length_1719_cov_5.565505:918-1265(+)
MTGGNRNCNFKVSKYFVPNSVIIRRSYRPLVATLRPKPSAEDIAWVFLLWEIMRSQAPCKGAKRSLLAEIFNHHVLAARFRFVLLFSMPTATPLEPAPPLFFRVYGTNRFRFREV